MLVSIVFMVHSFLIFFIISFERLHHFLVVYIIGYLSKHVLRVSDEVTAAYLLSVHAKANAWRQNRLAGVGVCTDWCWWNNRNVTGWLNWLSWRRSLAKPGGSHGCDCSRIRQSSRLKQARPNLARMLTITCKTKCILFDFEFFKCTAGLSCLTWWVELCLVYCELPEVTEHAQWADDTCYMSSQTLDKNQWAKLPEEISETL